jgi:hypothetical protein
MLQEEVPLITIVIQEESGDEEKMNVISVEKKLHLFHREKVGISHPLQEVTANITACWSSRGTMFPSISTIMQQPLY